MSLKDSINRKVLKQKLWNNSESAVKENLLAMAMINPGLIVLENCQAILRKDYDNMPGKVKILTGGAAGNEPAYAGFVGPGMLTAFISGNIYSSPSCDSILKVIEDIGTNHTPGVLIIIENRLGYHINFTTAVLRAESKNLNVKLIIVGEETFAKSENQSMKGCLHTNIIFLLKIAGAMAEEKKSLYEIYSVCQKIATSGEIISINVGVQFRTESLDSKCEMEIGHGTHGEAGMLKVPFTNTKNMVSVLLKILLKLESTERTDNFAKGCKIAIIVNNTGGSSQLETNIFTKEILHQLSDLKFLIERVYVGTFISILDHKGFHVSLIDLSSKSNILKYFDEPVKVSAWPRSFNLTDFENIGEFSDSITTSGRYVKDNEENLEIELMGPSISGRSAQAFLTILTFACEAVIACTDQINIMDEELGDGDCGTTLANGAEAIKAAIKTKKILGVNPYTTFTQISKILELKIGGIQGGMYSLFFQAIGKVFSEYSVNDNIDIYVWLNAFRTANKIISDCGGAKEEDRTMLNPLINAQKKLEFALNKNYHPIQAFGEAVQVAEKSAINTINMQNHKKYKYPDPGAHAVGIWMRAAYEGVKLKFACECEDAV